MTFDPIATATVPVAPNREPPFVHDGAVATSRRRLDDDRARQGST
jgi:hypothetical protein